MFLFIETLLTLLLFASTAKPVTAAAHHAELADFPQAAQSLVSATLGRGDAAYQFQPTADGYEAANSRNALCADFSSAGMRIQSGSAQWMMTLQSIGYGAALEAVSAVAPTVSANRLQYVRGAFSEWYVNGPTGLEQGWTLKTPPAARNGNPLTLSLALEGNVRVDASGRSVELVRDDGVTALLYTGLTAYDATGRELRARLELCDHARSLLQIRVDDADAQYPLTIDPYLLQATLTNSGGAANAWLGYSVAVSSDGSTIVAGALGVSSYSGAAYVFVESGGAWATTSSPTATLTNSGGAGSDELGYSVAISSDGSIIVAGALGVSSNKGAAYVFVKPGGGWTGNISTPTAILTNSSGAVNDYLGYSVAISSDGSTIVAGAPGVSSFKGAAYVFVKPAGVWATTSSPAATLSNSGGAKNDNLGRSVAISPDGSTIVAGADGFSSFTGAAYVFIKPGGSWSGNINTPAATLSNSGGVALDSLGYSVALSSDGSTIVAGAIGVGTVTGAAYVFVKSGSNWATTSAPTATLTNSSGAANDNLGTSVAVSSDGLTIVAGAFLVSSGKGAAYVFVRPGGGWVTTSVPAATLTNSGGATIDYVGRSVAISSGGSIIVAGAYGVSSSRGAAYVFFQPVNLYLPLITR